MRARTTPRDPRTPAQAAVRERFRTANLAYRGLSAGERQAWATYARAQVTIDAQTGAARVPQAKQVFTGLACKLQQVSPGAVIPTMPPAFGFAGDPILVTATAEGGAVTFTASGPTSGDVRVELLLQPLRYGGCAAQAERYRTQAFVEFAPGSLSVSVPVRAGWQAPAYKFVRSGTGQVAGFRELPPVEVGASEDGLAMEVGASEE